MSTAFVAIVVIALMALLAIRADRQFRLEPRIPMQWGLDGSVNWSAPRRAGLAFFPVTGAIVMIWFIAMAMTTKPRPGQEGLVLPAEIAVGAILLGCQILHLALARRTLRGPRP